MRSPRSGGARSAPCVPGSPGAGPAREAAGHAGRCARCEQGAAPMTECNTSLELLNAYVDGESVPPEELELRRHLDSCETCRRQVETLLALKAAVAASAETRPVPHTLRERLGPLARKSTRRYLRRRRWLLGLAAGVVIAVGVTGWFMFRPQVQAGLVTEALVARHLYFLQDPRAVQIATNDRQRIATWVRNKLPLPVRLPALQDAAWE